jgi:hypothetical protein
MSISKVLTKSRLKTQISLLVFVLDQATKQQASNQAYHHLKLKSHKNRDTKDKNSLNISQHFYPTHPHTITTPSKHRLLLKFIARLAVKDVEVSAEYYLNRVWSDCEIEVVVKV